MNVGILGSGGVAQDLEAAFTARGHTATIGGRDRFAELARDNELVVLAMKGTAVEEAIATAGADHFAGKIVIDVTNPLVFAEDGPPALAEGDAGGVRAQRALPGAHVVKAFNIVNSARMGDPPAGATMLIAGDDAGAKAQVTELLGTFGWPDVIDLGGIERSAQLEQLCHLWVLVALQRGAWDHAFAVVS